MPFLVQMLPAGKTWISVDVADLARSQGADISSLMGQAYADPSQYLDYLTSTTGPVEEVGAETVRGVEARRVRATLDLDAYVASLDDKTRKALGPLVDQFEQMVGSVKPVVEAWVDSDSLVRRIAIDMTLDVPAIAGGGVGGGMDLDLTMDLFDFGADVSVELPQARAIVDGSRLGLGG
jgi:hypothetical protein